MAVQYKCSLHYRQCSLLLLYVPAGRNWIYTIYNFLSCEDAVVHHGKCNGLYNTLFAEQFTRAFGVLVKIVRSRSKM